MSSSQALYFTNDANVIDLLGDDEIDGKGFTTTTSDNATKLKIAIDEGRQEVEKLNKLIKKYEAKLMPLKAQRDKLLQEMMGYKTELELLPTSSPGEFLRSYPWDKQLKSVLNDVFKVSPCLSGRTWRPCRE